MKTKFRKPAKIVLAVLVSLNVSLMVYAEGEGYGANNGGNSGTSVTVTTASELANYASSSSAYNITVSGTIDLGTDGSIDVGSNTTIQGENSNATILGTITIDGVSNVIIKYLNISAPTGAPGSNDGVQVRGGSSGVLITKCNIYDCTDGNLDITHGGGTVTVSWCKFYYTRDNGHNFSNLIGASDSDNGDYRTTWHHNWWAEGGQQRMIAARFGPCHMYNNYWSSTGNDYCTTSRNVCEMLSENNYYDNVEDPLNKEQNATLRTSGNIFNNCTGEQDVSSDNVFTPPYSYSLTSTNNVPSEVMAGAGNVGSSGGGNNGSVVQIRNRGTGLVVDGYGFTTNGDVCNQYSSSTTHPNSQWEMVDAGSSQGTFYYFINEGTGMRLDGMGRTSNGADVGQYANTTHVNAQWIVEQYDGAYYRIQNRGTGLYLDGMGRTSNGDACGQYANTTHPNAQWELVSLNSARAEQNSLAEGNTDITVYPNPVNNLLKLHVPENLEQTVQVSIINHVGQRVMELNNISNGIHSLDVSSLESGLYFAEFRFGEETTMKKFTKQ